MQEKTTEEIYSSMNYVWPKNNVWYDYVRKCINQFVNNSLQNYLKTSSIYLNAGSGGMIYNIPGQCYHVDITDNLIKKFPYYKKASIEALPFQTSYFDATICVGSVLNYCDAVQSIHELVRTLKIDGYLVLEFERSNTGELWGSNEFGKGATFQKYNYMGNIHTICLYSEKLIVNLLQENGVIILKKHRFHCLSAVFNGLTKKEEQSGKLSRFDFLFWPVSYYMAHNVILLCKKITL